MDLVAAKLAIMAIKKAGPDDPAHDNRYFERV